MSLLGREVLGYVADSALWVIAVAAIAAVVAIPATRLTELGWRRMLAAGITGGVVAASLIVRFAGPTAWMPSIGSRPLPVAWTALGAICGVAVLTRWSRRPQEEVEPGRMSG